MVFGSILTFAGYLRLITVLGPDKAAYMRMLVPIIALTLSSIFEGYQWSLSAFAGLALVLAGNWWAMGRRRAPTVLRLPPASKRAGVETCCEPLTRKRAFQSAGRVKRST